ncbi:MAG TPA: cyclase [Chloroflexi bacterium]|nr:cyclase [Chloroflexota bacterium]|tara:strand:+ start:1355 stop:1993 length:639 start_codon:yes stop_codon:yes gene_type:complete
MTIIDVSVALKSSLPVWPGHPEVSIERIDDMEQGANANVSYLQFSAHSGTHVDAPLHFLQDGLDVTCLDLDVLIGPSFLVEAFGVNIIDDQLLDSMLIPKDTQRLLIKTSNSRLWSDSHSSFYKNFVAISDTGAQWIVNRGIKLVGIDYLSVAPYGNTGPTHRIFLGAGVVLVEGLDFNEVNQGQYQLICLPIKIEGCEGSPARVVLVDNNE